MRGYNIPVEYRTKKSSLERVRNSFHFTLSASSFPEASTYTAMKDSTTLQILSLGEERAQEG
jgi:hypothetical protein